MVNKRNSRILAQALWIPLWLLMAIGSSQASQGFSTTFTVSGTVKDTSGNPVTGAHIVAHCGWGTLRPTGETTTSADGSYQLHFHPGMLTRSTDGSDVDLQAATISVKKPGWYEINYGRQGNLGMAGKATTEKEALNSKSNTFSGVVVPAEPYRLDFTLAPAAVISGTFIDESGKPVRTGQKPAYRSLSLKAEKIPPSSSVWANLETDSSGSFSLDGVPMQEVWFSYRDSDTHGDVLSNRHSIDRPTTYTVYLTLTRGANHNPGLVAKLATAD